MIHSKQRQQIVALVITLLPLVIGALTPVLGVLVATEIDDTAPGTLRAIRVAVFDLDVGRDVDVESGALTDLVNVMIQTIPEVTVVNRTEMDTTAKEHQIALSGLVDPGAAVKLGGFLSAQYVIVGRASRIGQTQYLMLKIIDVETTVQRVASANARVDEGVEALITRLEPKLHETLAELQASERVPDRDPLDAMRKNAESLQGKVIVIDIDEEHVSRPLRDPAASMAVGQCLTDIGVKIIVPTNPDAGWREALLRTGKYAGNHVDFLLEGEGVSAYAAEIQGLISCRARVELRLIPVPGRSVQMVDKGIGAKADLVEALAAKAALEEAAVKALDSLLERMHRTASPAQSPPAGK